MTSTPERDAKTFSPREAYSRVREATEAWCSGLEAEDQVVQSMPDVSPTKWHRAHTSWFFETFLLKPHLPGYPVFNDQYDYLFNSYYYRHGDMHKRAWRGLLSRPTAAEVTQYRAHVDEHMQQLIVAHGGEPELLKRLELGLHHEQQHQELMLMDIKHVFFSNPLKPAFRLADTPGSTPIPQLTFMDGVEGIVEIGHAGEDFCFDNERPRHRTLVHAHQLANRLITNGEYREFMDAGGYQTPDYWLSEGWARVLSGELQRPLYWSEDLESEFTLAGQRNIQPNQPVVHVSYYEADAFARWAGARLPTEAEWEASAARFPVAGHFNDSGVLHPQAAPNQDTGLLQLFGETWEWTASPYTAYPGFAASRDAIGEYNGKFMCDQWVLKGGACVTPPQHLRSSYRNFFYAANRWQFAGIRLAKDPA